MAHVYNAYTKVIQNKTFYFVKKFQTYPDLKDIPPFMEGFGMHTDFDKACSIASIFDPKIKEQIFKDMNSNLPQAKVIELGILSFPESKIAR